MLMTYFTWLKLVRMSVDISSPWFVQELVAQNIGIVFESLSHLCPKLCKVVLNFLLIFIETLPIYTTAVIWYSDEEHPLGQCLSYI